MALRWRIVPILILSNCLLPIAIGIFAIGFFPYKPFIPGRNTYESKNATHPPPIFDKLVFMVVDALRSDFVYSNDSSFKFVQSLIRDGAAVPFTAHATSPTITMPRVKALTTGSVPSFLDVILNFAESDTTSILANQDTWPTQLSSKAGGNVVMYGDDTWLKLFPNTFHRSDGTTSFFVSDFTEVDNNVTRHIPLEMSNEDWNGIIMHYLGLDHIGHKSGPRSPHMRPKQQEMDDIVHQIYSAIEMMPHLNSTLLVLCGDHGMNEAGNHGGSAPGETSPALVFMSPKFPSSFHGLESPILSVDNQYQYYDVVEQSDVAPTLAGLLGFPVPLNNLGVFIPRMLKLWSISSDRLRLVQQNADQVYEIVKATFGTLSVQPHPKAPLCRKVENDGDLLHCLWSASSVTVANDSISHEEKIESVLSFLKHAQDIMSSTASNYDVGKLQLGVTITILSTLVLGYGITQISFDENGTLLLLLLVSSAYGGMMFASSFVEEEHHFWYWSSSAWLLYHWIKSVRQKDRERTFYGSSIGIVLILFRVIRRWNQSGQKHAGAPDIGGAYFSSQPAQLWWLIALTFVVTGYSLNEAIPAGFRYRFALPCIVVLASAAGFKVSFTAADAPELLTSLVRAPLGALDQIPLTTQATCVFIGLAWYVLALVIHNRIIHRDHANRYRTLHGLQSLLTILLITQSRVTNVPLFLLFWIQFVIMESLDLSTDAITLASIFLQYASYFAFGGTNAISSIDLSSAYNGVSSYNVLAVGILTFISNWAGPIFWSFACCILLLERGKGQNHVFMKYLVTHSFFGSMSLLSVMMACMLLRTHLFIWTVFSPKYLYSMAWSLGQHLCINIVIGSTIWKFGIDR